MEFTKYALGKKSVRFSACLFFLLLIAGYFLNSEKILAEVNGIYDDKNDEVAGINALMSAVVSNDVDGVRFFSKAGRALVNQKNFGGATALHLACREKNSEIIKILIEAGADVNATDNEGWTPLMRSCLAGDGLAVDLLLNHGATASSINLVNETAIIHATLSDCNECLSSMFEKFNFLKNIDVKLLKEQLSDAFVLARNRDNEIAQGILESYLDQVIKMSPLITKDDSTKIKTAAASSNGTIFKFTSGDSVTTTTETRITKKDEDEPLVKIAAPTIEEKPEKETTVIKYIKPVPDQVLAPIKSSKFVQNPQDQKIYKFMGYCKCDKDLEKEAESAKQTPISKSISNYYQDKYPNKKPEEMIFLIKKDNSSQKTVKNEIKTRSGNKIFTFKKGEAGKIVKRSETSKLETASTAVVAPKKAEQPKKEQVVTTVIKEEKKTMVTTPTTQPAATTEEQAPKK